MKVPSALMRLALAKMEAGSFKLTDFNASRNIPGWHRAKSSLAPADGGPSHTHKTINAPVHSAGRTPPTAWYNEREMVGDDHSAKLRRNPRGEGTAMATRPPSLSTPGVLVLCGLGLGVVFFLFAWVTGENQFAQFAMVLIAAATTFIWCIRWRS
jgi:hypothetical protein